MDEQHLVPYGAPGALPFGPSFKMNQQVFGAAPDPGDPSPPQTIRKVPGKRDAQIVATRGDAKESASFEHGGKPPTHRLDLGKFRHGGVL